jgi:hypothetical protein
MPACAASRPSLNGAAVAAGPIAFVHKLARRAQSLWRDKAHTFAEAGGGRSDDRIRLTESVGNRSKGGSVPRRIQWWRERCWFVKDVMSGLA